MPRLINLIGQKFGKLTAIKRIDNNQCSTNKWLCECECKQEKVVTENNLTNGNTNSCGCLKIKHGHNKNGKQSIKYKSWSSMVQRCTNINNRRYKEYGGKGIAVCEEWLQFEIFDKDMPGWKPELQIDRINNNQGYCKENCRWATRKQQQRNKRNNRYETYKGKRQLVIEWAEGYNIPYKVLWARLYQLCWSIEKALTTPVRKCKIKGTKNV